MERAASPTPDGRPNVFGRTLPSVGTVLVHMVTTDDVPDDLHGLPAPRDRPRETLAAADLPPPEPLRRTLERLAAMDDETVLVQYNDRAPQHLYSKLEDRGYEYATTEMDEGVVTAIWRP